MSGAAQQAQAPVRGMKRIPFPLESYQHASLPLSAKFLLNLYAEQAPSDARSEVALIPTPGLVDSGWTFGAGPVTAMNGDWPSALYVASGGRFYRLGQLVFNGPIVVQDLGAIGTPSGDDYPQNLMTTIAVGVNAVVVCVPPNAFTCGHHDTAVNQIGGTFPGARSVAYLDGYFVFTSDDLDAQFFCSLLLDPSDFDALDFASADGVPNMLRRVLVLRGELWLSGEKGAEVWYDAGSSGLETTPGTSFFPFRRRAGGVIPHGTTSMKSFVVCDGSIFWLTNEGIVVRSQGYAAVRISTHAIEAIIKDVTPAALTTAVAFMWDGHYFYAMSFGDRTLVYDCATKLWHDRASSVNGLGQWLPYSVGQLASTYVFGSSVDGRSYVMSATDATEAGVAVMRQAITPPLWAGTNRAFCSRLEVEMEVGGDLDVALTWSDDGGWNYAGGPRKLYTGGPGAAGRRTRVYTTRLGSFRQRVFALTTLGRVTLYAIDADIAGGAS